MSARRTEQVLKIPELLLAIHVKVIGLCRHGKACLLLGMQEHVALLGCGGYCSSEEPTSISLCFLTCSEQAALSVLRGLEKTWAAGKN